MRVHMSHCCHTALLSTALTAAEPDWVLEGSAPWQARDSQAEWVFRDRLWIAGGHARPLSSEVWSLSLPADWKP